MGVVYLAHDRERRMRVALKTLLTSSPVELARLKREFARSPMSRIRGSSSSTSCSPMAAQWFFTMEAIDGVPFDAWCARDPAPGEHDELVASRLVRAPTSRSRIRVKRSTRATTRG